MKIVIRDRSQFHNHVRNTEAFDQSCSRFRMISTGRLARRQMARQEEFDRSTAETTSQNRQGADQRLEIPVVVVVTDEQEFQRLTDTGKLSLDFRTERA